jgi:hypothetical protein
VRFALKKRAAPSDGERVGVLVSIGLVYVLLFVLGGIFLTTPRRRDAVAERDARLDGWIACELALQLEGADEELVQRVRTRVPPSIRLRYEELNQAAEAAVGKLVGPS